jgi:hypothetical protein
MKTTWHWLCGFFGCRSCGCCFHCFVTGKNNENADIKPDRAKSQEPKANSQGKRAKW